MADGHFDALKARLLHLLGDADCQNLLVRGTARLRGALQLAGSLAVTGSATLQGGATINNGATVDNLTVTGTASSLLRGAGFLSSGSVLLKQDSFVGGSDGFGDVHVAYGTAFPNNGGQPVCCMGDVTILNCIVLAHNPTKSGFLARIVNPSNGNSYVNSGLVRINYVVMGN